MLTLFAVVFSACHGKVPDAVKPTLEAHRADARAAADAAVKLCPSVKGIVPLTPGVARPPLPPSPAKGTPLEGDPKVIDVFVMCSWPSKSDPALSEGTGLPSLRGTSHVPTRPVTMSKEIVDTTCDKDAKNCEAVVVPSRYDTNDASADLRVVRPLPDGGWVELVMVLAP